MLGYTGIIARNTAVALFICCAFASSLRADVAAISRSTLANGLTVLIEEDHRFANVGVAVGYPLGERNDPPGLAGLAHVIEHAGW